ncbi:unnamed protein product [Lupinus luteus]|uniref:Uncharacterized protein n=1 Tax=Lupinus luteus TaxID=3873 RepID=A0AAV1YIH7_LUPLU
MSLPPTLVVLGIMPRSTLRLVLLSMQELLVQKSQIHTKQLQLVTPLETLSRIHLNHHLTSSSSLRLLSLLCLLLPLLHMVAYFSSFFNREEQKSIVVPSIS